MERFRVGPLDVRVRDASLDLGKPLPVTLEATINDHAALRVAGNLMPPVAGGRAGRRGHVLLAPPERKGPALRFAGDVSIDDFRSIDNAKRQESVGFRGLQLRELRYDSTPDALDIDLVRVDSPYARDHQPRAGPEHLGGARSARRCHPGGSAATQGGGRRKFSDLSIQPHFAAEVRQLNGTVTGLSSSFRSNATVDF